MAEEFTEEQLDFKRQQLEYLHGNLPQFEIPLDLCELTLNSLQYSYLRKLEIRGSNLPNRFNDNDIIHLIEGLVAANVQLEELSLPYHRITDTGFEEILRMTKPGMVNDTSNSTTQPLTSISLEGNDITGNTLENTPLNTKYDCHLQFLNLSANPINLTGQFALAAIVAVNQILRHLIIDNTSFELKGIILLLSNLCMRNDSNDSTLQKLSINRPMINNVKEEIVMDHFYRLLMNSKHSLVEISLKYFNISDLGAKLLADALYTNKYLFALNLESNNINIRGAEALATYILTKKQYSIQYLGLSYNKVSDDGAIALAETIRNNTGLKYLTLKNNSIGPIGLEALANALESANNLESLTIFGNNFDNKNGIHFHDLIKHRLPYMNMYLDIDVYIVDGVYKIAEN